MSDSFDKAIREYPDWDEEWWQARDPRVRREIVRATAALGLAMLASISECESPIEELLGLHLHYLEYVAPFADGGPFVVEPQYEIATPEGRFRVDFFVTGQTPDGASATLVIECDGHDYHERTKEQAEYDKRRDRALKLAGYDVIHFTGREIYRDPRRCASEVRKHFRALLERRGEGSR